MDCYLGSTNSVSEIASQGFGGVFFDEHVQIRCSLLAWGVVIGIFHGY